MQLFIYHYSYILIPPTGIYCLDVVIIKAFLFFVPLRKSLRGDEFTDVGKFLREHIHFLVQFLIGNLGVYLCAGDTFVPQYAADRLDRHAVRKAYHRCHRMARHVENIIHLRNWKNIENKPVTGCELVDILYFTSVAEKQSGMEY